MSNEYNALLDRLADAKVDLLAETTAASSLKARIAYLQFEYDLADEEKAAEIRQQMRKAVAKLKYTNERIVDFGSEVIRLKTQIMKGDY